MFGRKESNKEINVKKVNELLTLGNKMLKIVYALSIIGCIYVITMILEKWSILNFILSVLKIVAPLFIGIVVAWLFEPFVGWLQKKGVRRIFGTIISYLLLLLCVFLVIDSLIPILSSQLNDFISTVPSIFDSVKNWINNLFDKLNNIEVISSLDLKAELIKKLEVIINGITSGLPTIIVSIVKSLFSGIGVFVVGLIIGFYLLLSFDNVSENIVELLPKKIQEDTRGLFNEINAILRRFVKGTLLSSLIIFLISSIGFAIVGLKAPLLFGFICGLTNMIPYVGPYLGGAPAVIVAFSQGALTGILVLVIIIVVQLLEGNLLQPIIMSKSTKLHPVTIMLGLLVFGHFFGILGMLISTPVIAVGKTLFNYFDEKYDLLNNND